MNLSPNAIGPFNPACRDASLQHMLDNFERITSQPPVNIENLGPLLQSIATFLEDCSKSPMLRPNDLLLSRLSAGLIRLDDSSKAKLPLIQQLYEKAMAQLQQNNQQPIRTTSPSYLAMAASGFYATVSYVPRVLMSYATGDSATEKEPSSEIEKFRMGMKEIIRAFDAHGIKLEEFPKNAMPGPHLALQKMTSECIEILLRSATCEDEKICGLYGQFIDKLRQALNSDEFKTELIKLKGGKKADPSASHLLLICKYRFTEVNIHSLSEKMVASMVAKGLGEETRQGSQQDLLQLPMKEQMDAVVRAPKEWSSVQWFLNWAPGALNVFMDPHRWSNMPYKLGDIELQQADGSFKKVVIIRTGTPTMQRTKEQGIASWQGPALIVPEFEHLITAITLDSNKKILFISLQDERQRKIGTENTRNESLKDLRRRNLENFFLSILAQDNDFYKQRGEFAAMDNHETFMKAFLTMLKGDKLGYWFPMAWLEDNKFIDSLGRMMKEVHEDVFDKKDTLNQKERQDFIEIYYARLALHLLKYTGADYFCFCCKDSKDRAIKCFSMLFSYMLILLGLDENPEEQANVKVMTSAAALHVSQSPMNERKIRLLSALERLSQPDVKERIRQRKMSIGIKTMTFAR